MATLAKKTISFKCIFLGGEVIEGLDVNAISLSSVTVLAPIVCARRLGQQTARKEARQFPTSKQGARPGVGSLRQCLRRD